MKNKSFSEQEYQHYHRHLQMPHIGLAGQQRLKQARVLCVGAGGLGSAALSYLAAAGIGTLGMVDDDVVAISNLQRQILYTYDDIGQSKVMTACKRLQKMNPHIQLVPHHLHLTSDIILDLFQEYDMIVDGSDNFATRYLINAACLQLKKPHIYGSISQFSGQCTVFAATAVSPCLRCLFDMPPPLGAIPNCAENGVLGVLPGIIGSLQATEVMKLILEIGAPLIGKMLLVDALNMRFEEMRFMRNVACQSCMSSFAIPPLSASRSTPAISAEELQALFQQKTDFVLVDVREPFEYQHCHLDGKLIPLGELNVRLHELDKNKWIIVHCKHDGRSQHALQILRGQGFQQVNYLRGGIIAWIEKINPTLQKY